MLKFIEATARMRRMAAPRIPVSGLTPAALLMAVSLCVCSAPAQEPSFVPEAQSVYPRQPATNGTTAVAAPTATTGSAATPSFVEPIAAGSPDGKGVIAPEELARGDPSWHPKLLPHVRVDSYFDDNIFIQHAHTTADFVTILGIGLRAGWGSVEDPMQVIRDRRGVPLLYDLAVPPGNFLLADYTGSPIIYTETRSQDTYNQDALLRGGWTDGKLSLGASTRFQSLTMSDIDVGELVKEKVYTEALGAKYTLTDKTTIESNLGFVVTNYPGQFINSQELMREDWLDWQVSPKINMGPGVRVGLLVLEGAADQTYERLEYRASYQTTEKLSFNENSGVELRQLGGGVSSRQYPVFSIGTAYTPFDGTRIELNGYRDVAASALLFGQNTIDTGVGLTGRQRLFEKFYLTLIGGYEKLDYLPVAGNVEPTRNDDYFFARVAVAFDIGRRCNTQLFYNFQRDVSAQASNSFVDNQVGFEINYAF